MGHVRNINFYPNRLQRYWDSKIKDSVKYLVPLLMLYLVGISDTELENNDGANPLPQPEKVRSGS